MLSTTVVSGRLVTWTGVHKPYPVVGTALAAGLGLIAPTGASPAGVALVLPARPLRTTAYAEERS
ncbi:hypothetical protein [Nonomuraea sp. B5E05]|uniref:hypothetical protein n=1 Tax=Nonomuraea sp. B5E05 TaxID=3153569 RepID=UPI00326182D0